ncbi:MAG: hypothetical protein HZB46_18790, partial [Solirubrobacterales bacterium]|nr:hypothetical protein [Solirubrobacterales bacterium]
GDDAEPRGAVAALRAAAAVAEDGPGADAFSGYRHVTVLDRRSTPWSVPEARCLRPAGSTAATPAGCDAPRPSARFTAEGRQELWVDARWKGVRRDDGSRVTSAEGDPELAEALRREMGRAPATIAYVYGDGPFARAPLAELPTDPEALLAELSAAFDDGRWASGGAQGRPGLSAAQRRYELASFMAHLLAEGNATPRLRAAGFGALARMDGVRDLGTLRDGEGRPGHGIEVAGEIATTPEPTPAAMRLVFDEDAGEVLAWTDVRGRGALRSSVEWTYLDAEHVAALPAGLRAEDR